MARRYDLILDLHPNTPNNPINIMAEVIYNPSEWLFATILSRGKRLGYLNLIEVPTNR
jgi:hypothetical protein